MANLARWTAQYFVHDNRLATGKPDGSANEELGRRLVLEVLDDAETVSALKGLHLPADLAAAKTGLASSSSSQEHFETLTRLFDGWVRQTIGRDRDDDTRDPRFYDFLVVDERALRSLAALPNEIPPPDPAVPRKEQEVGLGPGPPIVLRNAKHCEQNHKAWYGQVYVWPVDSQAVARFDPDNNSDYYASNEWLAPCHWGWVKLCCADIPNAWFERLARASDDENVFSCQERSGAWRYGEG